MKRFVYLLILFSFLMVGVNAQTVDCKGTIRSWELATGDKQLQEYLRTHRCSCPIANQKPVCEPINNEPEPTSTPTPNPVSTVNPAEEQAKREAAWNARKAELLKLLKKAGDIETPQLPQPTPTPSQPVVNYAPLREQTAKRIKELNCSAFWGLAAATRAVIAKYEISSELNDDLELARTFAEMSEGAEQGKSLEGCPTVSINVPDIPPPIEENPQIRLFDSMSKDLLSMIPDIISTKKEERNVKDWQDEVKGDITRNRKEKAVLDRKPNTPKNRTEKQKKEDEFDALIKEALAAESEAKNLQGKVNDYKEKLSNYQNAYDTVTKEPNRAKEFLPK
jgi:hypothetical protein